MKPFCHFSDLRNNFKLSLKIVEFTRILGGLIVINKEEWTFLYQTTFFEIDKDFDPLELDETKLINLSGLWWTDPNNAIDYPQRAYQEQDLFRERSIEEILADTSDWQADSCFEKTFIYSHNQLITLNQDIFNKYFEVCEIDSDTLLNDNTSTSLVNCVIKENVSVEELIKNKYIRYGNLTIKKLIVTRTSEGFSYQESD